MRVHIPKSDLTLIEVAQILLNEGFPVEHLHGVELWGKINPEAYDPNVDSHVAILEPDGTIGHYDSQVRHIYPVVENGVVKGIQDHCDGLIFNLAPGTKVSDFISLNADTKHHR